MTALLEVAGLTVAAGAVPVVRGVDLIVDGGETLGLIGESGSGKTVTGLALLRLLPPALRHEAGSVRWRGQDLVALDDAAFQPFRGRELAMVFQDPVGAFNPSKRIGWHLRAVQGRAGRPSDVAGLLEEVGIADPPSVLQRYPHQLSGGMLQRVLIAMVLVLRPGLIVADEPTTNLDNIVEHQILGLFAALRRRHGAAFLFITHDIGVASRVCDRLLVLYAGQVVESGPAAAVLAAPMHPYTQGLIATARALSARAEVLDEIPGTLPQPGALPPGCAFQPRCNQARSACARPQALRRFGAREVRCLLHD